MNYKNAYENLKQDLFSAVRKKQFKYYHLQKNGRKTDIIREIIRDLDLDDEYREFIKKQRASRNSGGG